MTKNEIHEMARWCFCKSGYNKINLAENLLKFVFIILPPYITKDKFKELFELSIKKRSYQ